ncbi:MAG: hypothetical protein KAQ96_05490 [Thermoplasmata archaeon]|nr:hypothetical protein [Thermoplasmata archaeon]MCK5414761.1 hypothetical protein [Thermoplasmata archaeon]
MIYTRNAICAYCGTNVSRRVPFERMFYQFCSEDHAIEWEIRKAMDVH